MTELKKVTAVTVNDNTVKIEDAYLITESNGIYEVLVADGAYNATSAPKMGETVVAIISGITKAANGDIAIITKNLKTHATDLPKEEAKVFIEKLGHCKLSDALLTEKEFMGAMAQLVLNDDKLMEDAVDAAMGAIPEDSGETRESMREKIKEEAEAALEVEEECPFIVAFTNAFKK